MTGYRFEGDSCHTRGMRMAAMVFMSNALSTWLSLSTRAACPSIAPLAIFLLSATNDSGLPSKIFRFPAAIPSFQPMAMVVMASWIIMPRVIGSLLTDGIGG